MRLKLFPFRRSQPENKQPDNGHTRKGFTGGSRGATGGTNPNRMKSVVQEAYVRNVIGQRAAGMVAQCVAALPLVLVRGEDELDPRDLDPNRDPTAKLLQQPNLVHTWGDLTELWALHMLLAGEGLILGNGVRDGRMPLELWPLQPDALEVKTARGYPMPTSFVYRPDGGTAETYGVDPVSGRCNLLWTKRPDPAGGTTARGVSAMGTAAGRVDQHNAATRWNYNLLRRGGRPSGAFVHDEELGDESYSHLVDEVDRMVAGAEQAGRPLVLDGGLRWEDLSTNPKDLDWLQGQRDAAREVALSVGVPPQLIGLPDASTYANYKEARLAMYEDTVLPLGERWLTSLNRWFGDLMDGYLKVDRSRVDALSLKREQEWDRVEKAGSLTLNEKRERLGYPPIEGGDEIYMPPNRVPLELLAQGIGLEGGSGSGDNEGEQDDQVTAAVSAVVQAMDNGELTQEEAVARLAEALNMGMEDARDLLQEADKGVSPTNRLHRALTSMEKGINNDG